MKKSFPCYGCEDRVLGCHGTCEKYAKARSEVRKEQIERWKAYEADSYLRGIVVRNRIYKIKERAKR